MKKLLLPLLLVSSLYAERCWNTDIDKWIPFDWMNVTTVHANAVDSELNKLEVYPAAPSVWGCTYIKEYQMITLTPKDIKVIKKTLKHGVNLGIEHRTSSILIFTESPQSPQEIIGTIESSDLDEIFEIIHGV